MTTYQAPRPISTLSTHNLRGQILGLRGSERADFRPERADSRPERVWGGDARMKGRTKVPMCFTGLRPLRGCCPKTQNHRPKYILSKLSHFGSGPKGVDDPCIRTYEKFFCFSSPSMFPADSNPRFQNPEFLNQGPNPSPQAQVPFSS